jgi:carboxypeptidase Q
MLQRGKFRPMPRLPIRRLLALATLLTLGAGHLPAQSVINDRQRSEARALIDAALRDTVAYDRLSTFADRYGHRLSGSKFLEDAIDWILAQMRNDDFANVRGEPVMVPHWVRGEESATLVSPRTSALHMLGLGNSVGTPADGITAPVLVVGSFDELTRRAAEAKGKIVLFDHPFPADKPGLAGYREANVYRGGSTAPRRRSAR